MKMEYDVLKDKTWEKSDPLMYATGFLALLWMVTGGNALVGVVGIVTGLTWLFIQCRSLYTDVNDFRKSDI